ncbi:uncharacterized protein LOC124309689 [Neodiprion virginianus]|uniref:uncharacterized protein LOC124309689 n=1 Tax=Neodiprion virginianus TaxID=2961670 RepID=UPI001EE6D71C|nr:uncharacterized protein LOC124309689 [Neodiprion virginianus]
MKTVLVQGHVPKHLHVNQSKEFHNKEFTALMTHHGINMHSSFSNLKASICERFNRKLKNKMWKQFTLRGSYKWLDNLPKLIESDNNTKHRTIRIKPKYVMAANEKQ